MDSFNIQGQADMAPPKSSQQPSKSSRKAKNDRKWDLYKEEIRGLYVDEKNPLQVTMRRIEAVHGFKASARKWKQKLKEWNFDKYLNAESMNLIVAKAQKRRLEEGKDTVFFHAENRITEERIENFKKRQLAEDQELALASVETPANITYYTPRPEVTTPSVPDPKEDVENHYQVVELSGERGPSPPPFVISGITPPTGGKCANTNAEVFDSTKNCASIALDPSSKTTSEDQKTKVQKSQQHLATNWHLPNMDRKLRIHLTLAHRPGIEGFLNIEAFYGDIPFDQPEVGVADGIAEEAFATAFKHRDNGELLEAEIHFIAAIYLYARSSNAEPLAILCTIMALGHTYEVQGFFFIPSFTQLFGIGTFGAFDFHRLEHLSRLPSSVEEPASQTNNVKGAFLKAENMCLKALAESTSWSRAKTLVRCCSILAELLRRFGDLASSKVLLLEVLTSSLRESWIDEIAEAVDPLLAIEYEMAVSPLYEFNIESTNPLEIPASNPFQSLQDIITHTLHSESILNAVELAILYSKSPKGGNAKVAELLLQSLTHYLRGLRSDSFVIKKSQVYLKIALCYFDQRRWSLCARSLKEAHDSLAEDTNLNIKLRWEITASINQLWVNDDWSSDLFKTQLQEACFQFQILLFEVAQKRLRTSQKRGQEASIFPTYSLPGGIIQPLGDSNFTTSSLPDRPSGDGT